MIDDLMYGLDDMNDAHDDYDEARRYYEGKIEEFFSSARIRRLVAATGKRYRFNLARKPVDALVNRVELAAVTVPNDQTATDLVQTIWDANDMDVESAQLHRGTFEFGDSYLMVWPYEEDPDSPVDDPLAAAGVEMVFHSPMCVRVIYDEENQRRKAFAIKRWQEGRGDRARWRADLYYPTSIERWVTRAGTAGKEPGDWEPYTDDGQDAVLPNEYGEIPFFHFRTDFPYGRPVHTDAYGPQDAINKTLITQLTTMDSAGWPERWALTDTGAELDAANDDPDWDDDADADDTTIGVGGQSSSTRTGPGTVTTYHGMKSVGQFDPANPGAFIEPAQLFVRLMAVSTDTPLHEFDPGGDQPSGESRRVAESPLVKHALSMHKTLRSPWVQAWRFALKVAGVDVPAVDIRWVPPASIDDPEGWQVIEAKQRNGVPREQTLVEAGYQPEQAEQWAREAEQRAAETARQMADAGRQREDEKETA